MSKSLKISKSGKAEIKWCDIIYRHSDGRSITFTDTGSIVRRSLGHNQGNMNLNNETQFDAFWDVLAEIYKNKSQSLDEDEGKLEEMTPEMEIDYLNMTRTILAFHDLKSDTLEGLIDKLLKESDDEL